VFDAGASVVRVLDGKWCTGFGVVDSATFGSGVGLVGLARLITWLELCASGSFGCTKNCVLGTNSEALNFMGS
jgi:hypothetical protein